MLHFVICLSCLEACCCNMFQASVQMAGSLDTPYNGQATFLGQLQSFRSSQLELCIFILSQVHPWGMFFTITGCWLDLTLMYCRVLLGFIYGLYSHVDKSMVTSKQLTTFFLLTSIVILNSFSWKILQMPCLAFSVLG